MQESLNPRRLQEHFGLPHPLSKFAENGGVKDNAYADTVLEWVKDISLYQELPGCRVAHWFLFESEMAFFWICSEAGIDGERLRGHLELWQQLDPEEMDKLIENEDAN